MPNIKSAKKRVNVINKKTLENKMIRTHLRSTIKKFNNYIDTLNLEEAEKMLPEIMSTIDSASLKGIIHKNTASNYKSKLSKRLADVKSGKLEINIKKDNKTIAAERAQKARETREAARQETIKRNQERSAQRETDKKAKEEALLAERKAKEDEIKAREAAEKAAKKAAKKAPKAAAEEKTPKTAAKAPKAKKED